MSRAFRLLRDPVLLLPLAGVALCAVLVAGGGAREADGAAAGAPKTHLGASANDHVTLRTNGATGSRIFSVVSPDGSLGGSAYTPAAGTGLLVREAEVVVGWTNATFGTLERTVRLRIVSPSGATKTTAAILQLLPSHSSDNGDRIFHVATWRSDVGFLLGAGSRLEVDAPHALDIATGDMVAESLHGDAVVRGVLVRAAR
jgi:hypothetical protein